MLQSKAAIGRNGQIIQELPPFPGDPDGHAFAINDKGQAVGVSGNCSTIPVSHHAVLWQNGTVIDLGNLGRMRPNAAQDINNQGQVVGFSGLPDGTFHAFLWQNGVIKDLHTLPGDVRSIAFGINNRWSALPSMRALMHTPSSGRTA